MKKNFLFILLLTFPLLNLLAQVDRETRAVWIATNFRLDWPPQVFDEETQKKELIRIFDNIKKKNLNTVYFQVRSNGTVLYKSSIEPFSSYFTGKTGQMPSYDPLEFAIKEAHKRGLEIHAWVNLIRCFSGKETYILRHLEHVRNKHENLVVKNFEGENLSYWLDPGLPETRVYLNKIVKELVGNYSVDGLQFDYIRYPGNDFDDDFSYKVYGYAEELDNWRRENLTQIVKELSITAKKIKPTLKVGAAPLGIYKNLKGATGNPSYSGVYQDSWKWIEEKYLDYIVPQMYWDLNGNPKFEVLAKNWRNNINDRNLVLGIGAYKDNVKEEIEELINVSRNVGAEGVAFFRYKNIEGHYFKSFSTHAYPSPMKWIDEIGPQVPRNLTFEFVDDEKKKIRLTWEMPSASENGNGIGYYTLYRLDNYDSKISSDYFFEVIEADKTSVVINIERPEFVKYYFALTAVDKLWNESKEASNVIEVTIPQLEQLSQKLKPFDRPVMVKEAGGDYRILLFSPEEEEINILAGDKENQNILQTNKLLPGKNILTVKEDLSSYSLLKIVFSKSGKEERLAL